MGHPSSREHVASRVGIRTRFLWRQNLGGFTHKPDARYNQRVRFVILPKRAISRESDTQPPVASANA